jgi:hypothetical protein
LIILPNLEKKSGLLFYFVKKKQQQQMFRIPTNYTPIAGGGYSSISKQFLKQSNMTTMFNYYYQLPSSTTNLASTSSSFLLLAETCSFSSSALFSQTQPLYVFAHWYAGKHKRHRYARERRYHPNWDIAKAGRNRFSRKLHWKTNRWNYQQAYRDMP